jgi:hypothetical protein
MAIQKLPDGGSLGYHLLMLASGEEIKHHGLKPLASNKLVPLVPARWARRRENARRLLILW